MKVETTLFLLTHFLGAVQAATTASSDIWFRQPAAQWTDALPVGNGRLGAIVHGGTGIEKIGLNEDSIWSGGLQRRVNSKASGAFPNLRRAFEQGNISQADTIWRESLTGTGQSVRQYQPAGNMMIEFLQRPSNTPITDYTRRLDLKTGISTVSLTQQNRNSKYVHRAVASYPHDVLGFRYASDMAGTLDMSVSLTRAEGNTGTKVDLAKKSITLYGQGTNEGSLKFVQSIRILADSGTFTANNSAIQIKGSKTVFIYWDAETTYRYDSVQSAEAAMNKKLDAATAVSWDQFEKQAVDDYKNLSNRVQLDLGNTDSSVGALPTNERLTRWKANGNARSDPELLALVYNYGRFLLIGSSRAGSLPSNLQGVWNDQFAPPWGSRYTININTEMNYFPAETTNLADTHGPVFELLKRMKVQGEYAARGMYNMNGWVCHHNTDLWGDCVPVDDQTYWAANPVGGAWLALQLIEHFRFNGDKNWASQTALPLLKGAITFFQEFTVVKEGWNVLSYDSSPENSYTIPNGKQVAGGTTGIDQGSAHARQTLYELFSGFIELSQAVGSTDGVDQAKQYLSKIKPPGIGSMGQLMEWSGDFKETEPGHRHLSHLLGVYPGGHISPLLNRTVSDAALVSMNRRLQSAESNIGWSKAWAGGIFARLFKGNEAVFHLCDLISNYLAGNLFDLNIGVFQIDGNLGLTGSLTEVFLQSHVQGLVHLAPALPNNLIPTGSVSGLVARGGFVVGLKWSNYRFVSATVESRRGGTLALRVEDGRSFKVDGAVYSGSINAVQGKVYQITL